MSARKKKPHISYRAFKLLQELHEYITQYDLKGQSLVHNAASDVFDGAVGYSKLEELHKKRWLRIVKLKDDFITGGHWDNSCGSNWTVELTDIAIKRFWPERLA